MVLRGRQLKTWVLTSEEKEIETRGQQDDGDEALAPKLKYVHGGVLEIQCSLQLETSLSRYLPLKNVVRILLVFIDRLPCR